MADSAAKREARIRRILENSESRLQKISGQTSPNVETPPATTTPRSESSVPNTLGLSGNNIFSAPDRHNADAPWTPTPEIDHLEFERKIQQIQNEIFGENGLFSLAAGGDSARDSSLMDLLTSANNANLLAPENQRNSSVNTKSGNSYKHKTIVHKFLSGLWIYVLLAAIVNLMIVLQVEHLFGTSILVPFIVIFISRVFLFHSLQQTQDSSMLMAALVLSNIRPELIQLLKSFLKISSTIFKEVSVFVFSFVLIYNFLSRHWLSLEELVDKPQVIIDHSREL